MALEIAINKLFRVYQLPQPNLSEILPNTWLHNPGSSCEVSLPPHYSTRWHQSKIHRLTVCYVKGLSKNEVHDEFYLYFHCCFWKIFWLVFAKKNNVFMHIVNFPPIMNSNNQVFMLLRGLEMHFLDMALLIRKLSEPRFMKDIDIVYII